MKTVQTDTKFCRQKNHIVPREMMTKLRSDDGRTERDVCEPCRKEAMDRRAAIKATKVHSL